jgi:NADPH-dependent 2,4-dienoyl-CoA reductase/sulfur reductase-like enzyme/peroxiredoxin family protein/rhodanese-related sulfurtransferase/TusA-related sulfurtransferase
MAQGKRIVIIGGVAGGASAAARARRLSEDAHIIMLERGPDISFANCGLPYHIGGAIEQRERLLVQTPAAMHKRYRIDVRVNHEATGIDRENRQVHVRRVDSGEEFSIEYDELILSPGAEPTRPPIEGLAGPGVFTLRTMGDMDAIKKAVDAGISGGAVVIGGGYIGLEMAEALRERGAAVTLVELADQVFVALDRELAAPLHQQLTLHGVDLRLGNSVTHVRREGESLRVRLSDGEELTCGMMVVATGVRPEVKLAREAGLEIGELGGIVVDDHMRTSDPHIFAVGDAVESRHFVSQTAALIPLAGPANRQGRIAADNALGGDSTYRCTQGTAICKVFDTAVAMTGLSEKLARKLGVACEKVYVHPASHAGYYPGAAPMTLKLLFDPASGAILGAQAVGAKGVDKRIDVIATAMRAHMTVFDLKDLELCYAPPYGSAKDPVNYAGFVASNVLEGRMKLCHVEDVREPREDQLLVDVRTEAEVEAGTIAGAINVPLDDLRGRIDELPRDRELLVFCQVGLRGYIACRILDQHGFKTRNLAGGYKTYLAATDDLPPKSPPPDEIAADTGETQEPMKRKETDVPAEIKVARRIDARGMQCPGPIMQLKAAVSELGEGEAVEILAADPGFPADVKSWCHATGYHLVELGSTDGYFRAVVANERQGAAPLAGRQGGNGKTIIVFSDSLDRALASFIIANGAASMGGEVTLFFTFWGLNVLRRDNAPKVSKNFIERMFGWMMPRGPRKLGLSKLNMGGMGASMIRGIMKKKNVPSLDELIASAKTAGVRLVACTMTMELMGIRREELIDGVEEGGVATYLDKAQQGNVNLFI